MNEWYIQGIFSSSAIQFTNALFILILCFLYDYPKERGSVNLQSHSQQNIICERRSNVVELDQGKQDFFFFFLQKGCAENQ